MQGQGVVGPELLELLLFCFALLTIKLDADDDVLFFHLFIIAPYTREPANPAAAIASLQGIVRGFLARNRMNTSNTMHNTAHLVAEEEKEEEVMVEGIVASADNVEEAVADEEERIDFYIDEAESTMPVDALRALELNVDVNAATNVDVNAATSRIGSVIGAMRSAITPTVESISNNVTSFFEGTPDEPKIRRSTRIQTQLKK